MPRHLILFALLILAATATAGMMGGGMMNGGMMGAQSPAEPPAKGADPAIRKGYDLTHQFCVQCHQAPNPVQHTAADWPQVVSRMQVYMNQQHRQAPDANERQLILNYLSKSDTGQN